MPLTDTAVRAAKPKQKLYKLSDGGALQLWVFPNTSRLWRFAYRFDGKQKLLALGAYPAVGLKDARERKEEARRILQSGRDPSVTRKAERRARRMANAETFNAIADEFLSKARREGRADATMKKLEWLVDLARAELGARPMAEISAPEVLEVLRAAETRGRLETARRMRSTISGVFRYAIATARVVTDPTIALQGALTTPTVKHRAAIIKPEEFGLLLKAIDNFDGHTSTRIALQLLALTAVRPGEMRAATWEEFDLDKATWLLPEGKTKMRRAHVVPLPLQALKLLKDLKQEDAQSRYLFPSVRSLDQPMSENTLNAALRRIGYSGSDATAHGFRSTFSTLANESGLWSFDAIERALAHVDSDDVRRAYHRGAHWDERVRLAQWYADLLDELRSKLLAERPVSDRKTK